MIREIIDISLDLFEQDCQQLKALDYPTIHNRGFLEFHLTKTLSRRIQDACFNANIPATREQKHKDDGIGFLPIYQVSMFNTQTSKPANVWIIGEHLISARTPSRQQLFKHIERVLDSFYTKREDEECYLLLVCDHWFDRNHASKTLPAWWLGQMPDSLRKYRLAGMLLKDSDDSLKQQLKEKYRFEDGIHTLRHPLYKVNGKTNILKYMLLTAVYTI